MVTHSGITVESSPILADFLNHGLLPFVGRGAELNSIVEFWRQTPQAERLRGMLVTGEAGVGKSRLVEEATKRIRAEHGVTVHVKFYPDSASLILPALAQAIHNTASEANLTNIDPGTDQTEILAALKRIVHLRPVLLILEDIHLLTPESNRHLRILFDALAAETVSVLFLARPHPLAVREVINTILVSEYQLGGLGETDLGVLWHLLFGDGGHDVVSASLLRTTHGNGLAVRTALRGSLDDGVIRFDDSRACWTVRGSDEELEQELEDKVRSVSSGLSAHLGPHAQSAAASLACLGEAFSYSTAMAILGNDEELLRLLMFGGVISQLTNPMQPLPGNTADEQMPLVFTHSLVHAHFLTSCTVPATTLVNIFINRLPLYSIVPFQYLSRIPLPTLSTETIRALQSAVYVTAVRMDIGEAWELAPMLLDGIERIVDIADPAAPAIRLKEVQIWCRQMRLNLMRRTKQTEEYGRLLEQFLEDTKDCESDFIVELRFAGLLFRVNTRWERFVLDRFSQEAAEFREFIDRYPFVRYTGAYIVYMQSLARAALNTNDTKVLDTTEQDIRNLLESPELPEKYAAQCYSLVLPLFLASYRTHSELEDRLVLMNQLDSICPRSAIFLSKKQLLCYDIGDFGTARSIIEENLKINLANGIHPGAMGNRIMMLTIDATAGVDPEQVYRNALELSRDAKADSSLLHLVVHLSLGLSACDALDCALRIAEEVLPGERMETIIDLFRADLAAGNIERALRRIAQESEQFAVLCRFVQDVSTGRNTALEAARSVYESTIPTISSLLRYRDLMALIGFCDERHASGLMSELSPEIHRAATMLLTWLDKRELWACMLPVAREAKFVFTQREFQSWRKRAYQHRDAAVRQKESKEQDTCIHIRVIGEISWRRGGDSRSERIRGERNHATLALMAANACLKKKLGHDAFLTIAMADDDPENARKKLKSTVYRLREVLGKDALLTDGETPEFNRKLVQVDLVDLYDLLRTARSALRAGSLLRASDAVSKALLLLGSDVIFPGLYDPWFEDMRSETEVLMRNVLMKVLNAASEANDAATVNSLVQCALKVMPGDEEVEDYLKEMVLP